MPSVIIKSGASLSSPVELTKDVIVNFDMPAAWTTANLTFQAAKTIDGTYDNVYDTSGTEITVTAAASRYIAGALKLAGIRFLKVRSGTSGTPVNQAADRVIDIDLG